MVATTTVVIATKLVVW